MSQPEGPLTEAGDRPDHPMRYAEASDPWADCEALRSQLTRSVRRVCPVWLADRAEDIVQAALIRVVELRSRAETPSPLPASYLWKVAYTATIDEIRRVRKEREVPIEALQPAVDEPVDGSDPLRDASLRELGRGLQHCLARLIEPRRLAVGLHLLGHSAAEIATIAGWDGKRSRNLLHRGLGDLRRCLAARGITP
ncbi:MAG: RNA polymerase sigma factor [Acidobacteria bacterium]|jgi:RNA polymerase sigma-70 factor (ECF subfamily)|nr:RNA polymerase sigma factor [Acidobacteriota bacterium]